MSGHGLVPAAVARLRAQYDDGATRAQLAMRFGLTPAQVREILDEPTAAPAAGNVVALTVACDECHHRFRPATPGQTVCPRCTQSLGEETNNG